MKPATIHFLIAVAALPLVLGGCVSMTPVTGGVLSTTYEQRFTDEAINRDWAAIDALRVRISEARASRKHPYAVARAEAELNHAIEEYEENDQTEILEPLLDDAQRLMDGLAAGSVDLTLPRFPAVLEKRQDLWELTDTAKKDPLLLECAGEAIAALEIAMLQLAHEEYEVAAGLNTAEHVGANILLVNRLAGDLREKMASGDCTPPPPIQPVAPVQQVQQGQAETTLPLLRGTFIFSAEVLFRFDKCGENDIIPEGKAQLDRFGELLLQQPDAWHRLIVTGHTDRLGRHKYNLGLSRCRANTVRSYLLRTIGLPPERVEATGMASTQPVTFCTGPRDDRLKACLQPNRRVEIELQ